MKAPTMHSAAKPEFRTDDDRWQAVASRDPIADGAFYYSVKTTGVYCRPICAARLANRKNVRFHDSPRDAERAGFRPCKRCRPKERSLRDAHAAAVAQACRQLDNSDGNVGLERLAKSAGLSPSHFHRVFTSMTGLTPKSYSAARRAERVRESLGDSQTITAVAYSAGYGSSSRFYGESRQILGMTPREFRGGGKGTAVCFCVARCSLGVLLVAASERGICAISLGDQADSLIRELHARFPHAKVAAGDDRLDELVEQVVGLIDGSPAEPKLPLDIQGTAFQQRVWRLLQKIPRGATRTYSELARQLGNPRAVRAVARACAANPLAVAIPCHRVVGKDGELRGYRWGLERKKALLAAEAKKPAAKQSPP